MGMKWFGRKDKGVGWGGERKCTLDSLHSKAWLQQHHSSMRKKKKRLLKFLSVWRFFVFHTITYDLQTGRNPQRNVEERKVKHKNIKVDFFILN